jgi:hypothetical protein
VTSIWARIYTAGAGWAGNQKLLETDDTGNASGVRIASSTDAGVISQAVAVWTQTVGPTLGVWSNRFIQGVGWEVDLLENPVPTKIDTSTNGARRPELAMNAEGDALAVWEQNILGDQAIWASQFVPGATGSGWEMPILISGVNNVDQENPQVAISPGGNGLALYSTGQTTLSSVRFLQDSGGWAFPKSVSGNARNAKIAIDAKSNGLAVWERDTGARNSIIANRWFGAGFGNTVGGIAFSWGTEQVIDGDGGLGSFSPQIGVDAERRALSIWEQSEGGLTSIWGNRLE